MDGNGEIDYSEWQVASINKYNILQEEKLREAFKLFDRDGSGEITAVEIKQILGAGKKFGSEKIFDDIIKEVDVNGDGVISFDEFKQMMQRLFNESEPQTTKSIAE
jgi:calcium-dependent protein kinase